MVAEERTTSSTGGQKGVKIERHSLIPTGPLRELAVHFGRGARKYDSQQWRKGYEWSKSYDALERHLKLFWQGFDYDVCSNEPDNCKHVDAEGNPFTADIQDACYNHTGSHHMVAVMWHAAVLLEFKDQFPEFDDRFKYDEKQEALDVPASNSPTFADFADIFFPQKKPAKLEWLALSSGEKTPVCVCSAEQRRAQPSLEEHYKTIHGVKI